MCVGGRGMCEARDVCVWGWDGWNVSTIIIASV